EGGGAQQVAVHQRRDPVQHAQLAPSTHPNSQSPYHNPLHSKTPVDAVGRPSGDLFAVHVSFAKTLDWYYRGSIGIEGYYEVDLTDKLVRTTRMTNYGANIFLRYRLFGSNFEQARYYPNPGGGRRHRY
ncbi:MAG: hypothetical protein ACKOZV_13750, partial [Bacteroidota bacterium]